MIVSRQLLRQYNREIKVQNLLDVALARVLGESGAKALLHYAKSVMGTSRATFLG